MDEAQYLSERQAAALLGLSVDTLRRLRGSGTGPTWARMGRSVRYQRGAVLTWAQAQHVPQGA